jgi:predicted nucleic acid-binding protein
MILVDTSVWIDFFNGKSTLQVEKLETFINEGENLCICGVILTEILQGIRDNNQHFKTKSYLEHLIFLPMNYSTFIKAAEIFRYLRKRGIAIRKPIDCMIAAVVIENKIPLLHTDRDFDNIERYEGFKTIKMK